MADYLFTPITREHHHRNGRLRFHVTECATVWTLDGVNWQFAFSPWAGGYEPAGVLEIFTTPTVVDEALATVLEALGAGTTVIVVPFQFPYGFGPYGFGIYPGV